jgi:uncharacterized protein YegP (UPF0339 family)
MNEDTRFRAESYQDVGGAWRWRLVAGNGQIVATSGEGYVKRAHAELMVESIFAGATFVTIAIED